MALTLVLLVVAGMLIRMVTRYRHADLGFDPAHILAVQLNLSPDRYQGRDQLADFYQPLFDRVTPIPGVQAAGLISLLPIEELRIELRHSHRGAAALSAQPGDAGGRPLRQHGILSTSSAFQLRGGRAALVRPRPP